MKETTLPNKIQKPHFVIRVSNTLTYLQRKAWALLYLNARNSLDDDFHYLPLSVIANTLETTHDNDLKESLTKLSSTAVEWNITGDDGEVESWTTSAMVASATIEKGTTILRYEFSQAMKDLFSANPHYATLELSIMNKLKSKHALALWEFCKIFVGTNSGSTGWKTVKEWRGVFAIQTQMYETFKSFKFNVLEKAVKEINEFSDIQIKPEYKRSGRSISEIRFLLSRDTKEVKRMETQLSETLKKGNPKHMDWYYQLGSRERSRLLEGFDEFLEGYREEESKRIGRIPDLPGEQVRILHSNYIREEYHKGNLEEDRFMG